MKIAVDYLRSLCKTILIGHEMVDEDAHIVTDILLEAELRGRPTHGLIRLPGIAERSVTTPRRVMRMGRDRSAVALIDGQGNLGYIVAHRCARTVVAKADFAGLGMVGAFNMSHCGMLGYYASMMADAGMVGLVMCDTSPRIVPWGGGEPVLGTNPIAAGFPAREGQVVVDFSTAAITNGEILMAVKDVMPIPAGLALDSNGCPTTDPEEALRGGVFPFGGPKGYALSLMIQIFSGVLVTAAPVPEAGKGYGIFMLAIPPSTFGDFDQFQTGLEEVIFRIKSANRCEGVGEILIPGERAFRERAHRLKTGIEVDEILMNKLKRLYI